jgi:hypothetical protein
MSPLEHGRAMTYGPPLAHAPPSVTHDVPHPVGRAEQERRAADYPCYDTHGSEQAAHGH